MARGDDRVNIQIFGLKEVGQYLKDLSKQLEKEIILAQRDCAEMIAIEARNGAPESPLFGGAMKNSILRSNYGKTSRVFTSNPYAVFQELGFTPHTIYPNMENRMGIKLKDMGIKTPITVRKNTPFMQPAFDKGALRLPNMLEKAVNRAIRD